MEIARMVNRTIVIRPITIWNKVGLELIERVDYLLLVIPPMDTSL